MGTFPSNRFIQQEETICWKKTTVEKASLFLPARCRQEGKPPFMDLSLLGDYSHPGF